MALADAVPFAVAHWNLDEASGTRSDSIGSNDLTDNNTVGSAAGKFDNAADFERTNDEYLSIADNADVTSEDVDIFLRCWVNPESLSGVAVILAQWSSASRGYILFTNDNALFFGVGDGSGSSVVVMDTMLTLSTGSWQLIHAWHSATSNQVGASVNAGTASTQATGASIGNSTAEFRIGNSADGSQQWDGLIDDVVILKGYLLDATERSEDYNSGTGIAFADWGGAAEPEYPLAAIHLLHKKRRRRALLVR